jgi:hypothetical protein
VCREGFSLMAKKSDYRDPSQRPIFKVELNKTKHGPLRIEHARDINFIPDFMAANKKGSRGERPVALGITTSCHIRAAVSF